MKVNRLGTVLPQLYRHRQLTAGDGGRRVPHLEGVVHALGLQHCLVARAVGEQQSRHAAVLVQQLDVHHAIVVFVGIGVEQDAIHHAEDSRGRANTQSKRKDRRQREAFVFQQLTSGEAKILQYRFHLCYSCRQGPNANLRILTTNGNHKI
jgi:hypothetical protein